jgi:hypothetical protein
MTRSAKDNSTLTLGAYMDELPADIVATIGFHPTDQGGRKEPTSSDRFRCPFEYQGEFFDCILDLNETGPVRPGEQVTVPVVFLFPDLIKPRLNKGHRFTLWDMRTIADGIVVEIVERESK